MVPPNQRCVNISVTAVTAFFSGVGLVNNADKAALLYNSRRKGTEITIEDVGGEALKSKEAEKLLGVTISSNLDWKTHVDNLCKTLKQRIGLLRRIKYKVNKDKLHIIAEAIFTSKIRYGIAVYSSPRLEEDEAENSDIQKIQVLQNDMLRLLKGHTRAEQVNMKSLREELMTLSVNQLACYHIALEMHICIMSYEETLHGH